MQQKSYCKKLHFSQGHFNFLNVSVIIKRVAKKLEGLADGHCPCMDDSKQPFSGWVVADEEMDFPAGYIEWTTEICRHEIIPVLHAYRPSLSFVESALHYYVGQYLAFELLGGFQLNQSSFPLEATVLQDWWKTEAAWRRRWATRHFQSWLWCINWD